MILDGHQDTFFRTREINHVLVRLSTCPLPARRAHDLPSSKIRIDCRCVSLAHRLMHPMQRHPRPRSELRARRICSANDQPSQINRHYCAWLGIGENRLALVSQTTSSAGRLSTIRTPHRALCPQFSLPIDISDSDYRLDS